MHVWAIADLHLALSVPEKKMDVFGQTWEKYTEKIKANWEAAVSPHDLVLVAGDITWALKLHEAEIDLLWVDALPGTKIMIKGNHDYWWTSLSKIEKILPPSMHVIQNNSFSWNEISIAGTRLWDTPEYNFDAYIDYIPREKSLSKEIPDAEKIFERELERLELSLKAMHPDAHFKIAMTHYPPIGADLKPSRASALLEKYQISHCIFGHLHNVKKNMPLFGAARGIRYALTSCDYLDFKPLKLLSL